MAGKTVIVKPNQILFKEGDASNGMYILRKGELNVFLSKKGKEINLANIPVGGMIGEMALFDQKPRSASVRATQESEVTHISLEDFQSLVKQIPKWFTALMVTLSGRLRATNERLQQLEANADKERECIRSALRILHVLDMFWHRDGAKDEKTKEWKLEREGLEIALVQMFCEPKDVVNKVIKSLIDMGLMTQTQIASKKDVFSMNNRGNITRFNQLFTYFYHHGKSCPLPEPCLEMLKLFASIGSKSAYDSFGVKFSELEAEGRKANIPNVAFWKDLFPMLEDIHPDLKLLKSNTGEATLRAQKKDIAEIVRIQTLIANLCKSVV